MLLNLWFIVGLLITSLRWYLGYVYALNKKRWSIERWNILFLVGVAIGASIWAVAPIFILNSNDILQHAMLIFIIAGVTAGSIASLAIYPLASRLFILGIMTPFIIKLLMVEQSCYQYFALLVFLYTLMLLQISKMFYESHINYLNLREELALSNYNLEFANQAFYDVLESLDAHVILLDSDLNIIKHTGGVLDDFFEISQHQNFVSINMHASAMNIPRLLEDIKSSIEYGKSVSYDIEYQGHNYYFSIKPMELSIDREIGFDKGVVMSFVDKTELTKKDQMLFHQSKMASMGELIGNIAHQWKQPLAALSNKVSDIYIKYQLKEINDRSMESFLKDSSYLIQKMSDTIDDFKNFFKPHKAKTRFLISSLVNESMALMEDALQNSSIAVHYTKKDDFILETYKSELIQVMVNLLSNSRDAININSIDRGSIEITTKQEGKHCVITLQDNGGGMESEIVDRIFEPYFSTKFQNEGTGLGLYMSKLIIDNSIHGKLSLKNHQNGVLATITIEQNP